MDYDVDYDSDTAAVAENMAIFWESQKTNSEEFGFSMYPVEMTTTREVLTRDNIPSVYHLYYSDVSDKACVICPMGGNWNYDKMLSHYDMYHNVDLCDEVTYEEWK